MNLKAKTRYGLSSGTVITLRCPACHQKGVLESMGINDLVIGPGSNAMKTIGLRRCPDPTCCNLIFFVYDSVTRRLEDSYPAERIDFDATSIPPPILKSFEEAITCHAQSCFVAASMLIRKTLEALCHDKGAAGETLRGRLKSLRSKVVLPEELHEGMDAIRLLGNDAAHIESRAYDQVGQTEVEAGIEFTKEILKAFYQYSNLLGRLKALNIKT